MIMKWKLLLGGDLFARNWLEMSSYEHKLLLFLQLNSMCFLFPFFSSSCKQSSILSTDIHFCLSFMEWNVKVSYTLIYNSSGRHVWEAFVCFSFFVIAMHAEEFFLYFFVIRKKLFSVWKLISAKMNSIHLGKHSFAFFEGFCLIFVVGRFFCI
jgi:hypothetical protein